MDTIHRTTKEKHRMSEMIERVARAIYETAWVGIVWPPEHEGEAKDYRNIARAAIEPIIAEINRIAADSLMPHPVWNAGVEAMRVKINAALKETTDV
jgi:hypothetical protein